MNLNDETRRLADQLVRKLDGPDLLFARILNEQTKIRLYWFFGFGAGLPGRDKLRVVNRAWSDPEPETAVLLERLIERELRG